MKKSIVTRRVKLTTEPGSLDSEGGTMSDFSDVLLKKVKNALRIIGSQMDDELSDIIDACREDLSLAGVYNVDPNHPMVIRAVILYSKANYSFNEDGHRFHQSYDSVKNLLRLTR